MITRQQVAGTIVDQLMQKAQDELIDMFTLEKGRLHVIDKSDEKGYKFFAIWTHDATSQRLATSLEFPFCMCESVSSTGTRGDTLVMWEHCIKTGHRPKAENKIRNFERDWSAEEVVRDLLDMLEHGKTLDDQYFSEEKMELEWSARPDPIILVKVLHGERFAAANRYPYSGKIVDLVAELKKQWQARCKTYWESREYTIQEIEDEFFRMLETGRENDRQTPEDFYNFNAHFGVRTFDSNSRVIVTCKLHKDRLHLMPYERTFRYRGVLHENEIKRNFEIKWCRLRDESTGLQALNIVDSIITELLAQSAVCNVTFQLLRSLSALYTVSDNQKVSGFHHPQWGYKVEFDLPSGFRIQKMAVEFVNGDNYISSAQAKQVVSLFSKRWHEVLSGELDPKLLTPLKVDSRVKVGEVK